MINRWPKLSELRNQGDDVSYFKVFKKKSLTKRAASAV